MNYLKPAREIVHQLNQWPEKSTEILIHGVGRIKNVVYHKECYQASDNYEEIWKFTIKLNDGIIIKCETYPRFKKSKEFFYFEEGDYIEFFGKVSTKWMGGMFCKKDVESILIYDAKLAEEKRYFSEVFMWNIKKYDSNNMCVAATSTEWLIESEIACIGELEPQENTWVYGQLVRKGKLIIFELIKMMGDSITTE